jgi:cytochrome c553
MRLNCLVLWLMACILCTPSVHAQSLDNRLAQCAACHGEAGNSALEGIPSLAGQPDFFILNQLVLLREGVRKVDAMSEVVKGLEDAQIIAIAAHYAGLPPALTGEAPDPAKVARGSKLAAMKRCESCHGSNLLGDQQVPRIAKQRVDYLSAALKAYRDNMRTGADTSMSAMIFGLSDAELDDLAHYAASR